MIRPVRVFVSTFLGHKAVRFAGVTLGMAAVLLSAAVVTSLTIDLGPSLKALAEREGSRLMKRTIHIGALKVRVVRGRVELDDLVVEGLKPADRPFFTAKHLSFSFDWASLAQQRPEILITSVEMNDWQMLVERFQGFDNFPKFRDTKAPPRTEPSRFVTTMKYFRAWRGQFAYEDHEMPWSILAPNLDLTITDFPTYNGEARFNGGLITIQDYVPMWMNFKARFTIDGANVHLARVDLESDGARSTAAGSVNFDRWPEQSYQVRSRVQFARMREIFFAKERWDVDGESDFSGTFHLFKGGHDLAGAFAGAEAGVSAYRFPSLYGSLHWTRKFFEVTDAGSKLYGGDARFNFSIKPLGSKERPVGRFDASYRNVDLAAVSDLYQLAGARFAGTASGRNLLEWPMGAFSLHQGDGEVSISPPPGARVMTAALPPVSSDQGHAWGPFAPAPITGYLPIAGDVHYRYGRERVDVDSGRFASERTHVTFAGSTEWGERTAFRFHVTSGDWQESDEVLAGILTDFGSRTRPVTFGGRGEFDGELIGSLRRPRVEGEFSGEALRAWDTVWGSGRAHIAVEDNYVAIRDAVVRADDSEIRAEGLFSLGYPRRDGG